MARFWISMVGLGFVLAFVGIILLIGSLLSIIKVRSFAKCSEIIIGRVGNRYFHKANNRRHYSMEIEYTVDGNDYKRSIPASESEYHTLKTGDPFEIIYRSDKPKKIIRVDSMSEHSADKMHKLFYISAVMTVVGIALILIRVFTV